ncbi:MAG: cupredoxin domain-containing protein [Candidatus Micrarchaeia archaeon]
MEGITIRKSTAYLMIGLVVAVLFGAYIVFSAPGSGNQGTNVGSGGVSGGPAQEIYIKALSDGTYDKQEVTVKKGMLVRLHFTADRNAGCGRQMVIYGLNVNAISRSGEESVVEFTPQQAGTFEYNCGMRMWRPGRLNVV